MAKKKKHQTPEEDAFVDNEVVQYPAFEDVLEESTVEESNLNDSVLPDDVAAVFNLNWKGGHTIVAGRFGRIDLRKLTVEKAEALVAKGFKYLVRKG